MRKPAIFIMSKLPQVGAVKTRLARDIGALEAWRFFIGNLQRVARNVSREPFWRTRLLITPDHARYRWPRGLVCRGQGRGDLGARMLAGLTSTPRGTPAIVIGGDIPGVSVEILRDACRKLRTADVVFGPATDGGYWLVGFSGRRRFWRPFAEIRWSTALALADTERNFRGLKVAYAATLRDVDDVSSWLLARGVP